MKLTHVLAAAAAIFACGVTVAQAGDGAPAAPISARASRLDPHDRADTPARMSRVKWDTRSGQLVGVQPVAQACDSILCPGYTMMGVGF